jgi:hypothetical protein
MGKAYAIDYAPFSKGIEVSFLTFLVALTINWLLIFFFLK